MKRILTTLIFALLLVISGGIFSYVQACNSEEDCKKLISEYEQKLVGIRDQKNTLASQIEFADTQIYLTTLRIQDTERKITQTADEIENLKGRIVTLNSSLDYISKLLLEKIIEGYKRREAPLLAIFIDPDNASTMINRLKYAKVAEESDRKLAFQVQQAKLNFEQQKNLRENKQAQLNELEKQLENQRAALNNQKIEKQELLRITQNDEVLYQRLLAQALAESQAIKGALATGQAIGPVKRGDPIALVGNSGYPDCSSGKHLHFEVHTSNAWNSWTDPSPYLSQWQNPLSDPITVTQNYGSTPWSSRYSYSGGIHTGIDMYSQSSDVIRAPADGTLYSSTWGCGSSNINVKYIDHGGGIFSFYLHVLS